MPKKLYIDIETYSSVDIKTSGAYKYTESIDFEILLIAYAFDDEEIQIIDLASGEKIPTIFMNAMYNKDIEKHAHNATFERICFKAFGIDIPIDQWHCTAIKSAYCGLPLKLDLVSKALKLGEKGKLSTGKALIKYFCVPCKPTKSNPNKYRMTPLDDPEKWENFKTYCINDVEAEREIDRILLPYTIPDFERINYIMDQEINDSGILINLDLVKNAVYYDQKFAEQTINRVKELTGIENPNSASQLKTWLSEKIGFEVKTLAKDSIPELIEKSGSKEVEEVLMCRIKLAKSSTKKYLAMQNCVGHDNRSRGLFQFYGANRTGRWAGRLIQLQNLPQNHMKDLDAAREIVLRGNYQDACLIYDNIPNILSELIRTAFIPKKGKIFGVSDFSAIEARVLSWVADEEWRMQVFRTHGKIYEASASMMFNVPIEAVTKGSDLRQKGKTAELALGYQGSVGAMRQMGGEKMGLSENEMKELVESWRRANPSIVNLWKSVENNSMRAIKTRKKITTKYLSYDFDGKVFTIELPSGRKLFYQNPTFTINRFGKESIKFMGYDMDIKQWTYIDTYGGKLVENIVQAISRDLLAYSMQRLREENFDISMHVHDEVVCELDISNPKEKLKEIYKIMGEEIPWAKGLPLVADGYITPYYKKD